MFATEQWVTSSHWLFAVFFWGDDKTTRLGDYFTSHVLPSWELTYPLPVHSFKRCSFFPRSNMDSFPGGYRSSSFSPIRISMAHVRVLFAIDEPRKPSSTLDTFNTIICPTKKQVVQKLDRRIGWIYSMLFSWWKTKQVWWLSGIKENTTTHEFCFWFVLELPPWKMFQLKVKQPQKIIIWMFQVSTNG